MTTNCKICGTVIDFSESKMDKSGEHFFSLCDRCCTHERCGPGDWSGCDCYDCGASMVGNVHNCQTGFTGGHDRILSIPELVKVFVEGRK